MRDRLARIIAADLQSGVTPNVTSAEVTDGLLATAIIQINNLVADVEALRAEIERMKGR